MVHRDLLRAIRDTGTLMLFFVGMAPLTVGVIFLYGVEPMLNISAGVGNQNWIEPIGIMIYLVGTALVVKWFLMPKRLWYKIPDT